MTDLKLFRISGGHATELPSASMALERSLQKLIEGNMDTLFVVGFLASEYSTGKVHGGRIDSLGLDENGSPVIFEYKRSTNENVINQGLFYLDWLLDHRAEFERLVSERIGSEAQVEWANPRLVCVANGFTRYDEHAVRQINRNIDLVRYRDFSGELFALELVTTVAGKVDDDQTGTGKGGGGAKHTEYKTVSDYLARLQSISKICTHQWMPSSSHSETTSRRTSRRRTSRSSESRTPPALRCTRKPRPSSSF
jgi:hypothetical protein